MSPDDPPSDQCGLEPLTRFPLVPMVMLVVATTALGVAIRFLVKYGFRYLR